MSLIPTEVKAALAYLKSIDKSLGRIAEALEKDNVRGKDNGYGESIKREEIRDERIS